MNKAKIELPENVIGGKNYCLINKVKCSEQGYLFVWYGNYNFDTTNNTSKSMQIEWNTYAKYQDKAMSEAPIIFNAQIIGNSYLDWSDEPDGQSSGYHVISEGFHDGHDSNDTPIPQTPKTTLFNTPIEKILLILLFIVIFIFVCLIIKYSLYY